MQQMTGDRLSEIDLQIDQQIRTQLTETGKWAKFISISIFIICALILIVLVAASSTLMNVFERYGGSRFEGFAEFGGGAVLAMGIFAILIAGAVYFFMFRFSAKIKNALLTENSSELNTGIGSLKVFFIITSVLGIVSLLLNLYSLFFITDNF